ncbi:hypothetical protein [Bradyrhizobium sp. HKCCYLRH3097]|uniref:hypothetical protein n=1 Tax=Bradyrhizobium sp. HKCCYLRH3097 TaxID=3420752 RepID=UPI003EBF5443
MTTYLRTAEDRKRALLDDAPDTKFEFESQKFSDIPKDKRPAINTAVQHHQWGAQQVKTYNALIEEAARRHGVNPDLVRAVIYTEVSRGGEYGYPGEAVGRAVRSLFRLDHDVIARTILPGNIDSSWQKLIPGSDVHTPRDNIELTAKLLAGIAKRLDDPSVENIYSLYNGLSHDRTYVNKQIKSTPYYAKRAFEDKAWEKDEWSAPDPADDPAEGGPVAPGNQVGPVGSRAPSAAHDAPAWFDDRFDRWSPPTSAAAVSQSPLLRELARRGNAEAAGAQPFRSGSPPPSLPFPGESGEPPNQADLAASGGGPDPVRSPIRILRSRRADQMLPTANVGPPGTAPNQMPVGDQVPSFDDRFGSWASTGNVTAPLSPYMPFLPMPESAGSAGVLTGNAMPDYPFEIPAFGEATPGLEDWAGTRRRRSPWGPAR